MRPFHQHLWACTVAVVLLMAGRATAQVPPVTDSGVSFIDTAIPATLFRLRYDSAHEELFPTRGEMFMARTPTPGLPLAERSAAYQELSAYTEFALDSQLSFFTLAPYRFVSPEINRSHSGLADVSAGFKWALIDAQTTVATLQFAAYGPTGDASRGLGTNHVTLEPGLLVFQELAQGLALEGEARYLAPIGGTSGFASNVVRYGIGLKYDLYADEELAITPVVEAVGWTFLDGKKTVVQADGTGLDVSASGDTVVNVFAGLRIHLGLLGEIYAGYGRCLTGDTLYREIYRTEWRLSF
jgi:hypothetical protein